MSQISFADVEQKAVAVSLDHCFLGVLRGQQANVFHRPAKEAKKPEVSRPSETGSGQSGTARRGGAGVCVPSGLRDAARLKFTWRQKLERTTVTTNIARGSRGLAWYSRCQFRCPHGMRGEHGVQPGTGRYERAWDPLQRRWYWSGRVWQSRPYTVDAPHVDHCAAQFIVSN